MNTLFRFIERYRFFLLFLVFEVFSFWLLSRHTYYQRSKFEDLSRSFFGFTSSKISNTTNYLSLNKVNRSLAQENLELKYQLAVLNTKYEILKGVYGDTLVDPHYNYTLARVVNNSVNKQFNYITLNVGSKQGVEKEMGVVTSKGIVGIVAGVSHNYSTVISLLNVDLKISAKLKKSEHFGSLYWNGTDYQEVVLSDIPQHVNVSIGDTVITSGFSSIFPSNINIGTIVSVDSKGSNFHTIKVKLFSDFKQLNTVWVVSNKYEFEREVLEDSVKSQ
jgi:rod shape-determining protein MreC